MSKNAKIIACVIVLLVMFGATARVGYELGERHISELILHSGVPDGKQQYKYSSPQVTTNDEALRSQLNRLMNDYESACYNYQTLYEAYDKLYAQAGASSGQAQIVRPDSARGNEVSCYR